MERVAILVDSSADISFKEAKKYGIHVLRMPIIIEDREYIEGRDIDGGSLYAFLKEGKLAKTTQSSPGEIAKMYEELLKEYDSIVYIPLSSGLSGQYDSACQVAKAFGERVVVIDAKSVCSPILLLIAEVKKMLAEGLSKEAIKAIVERDSELLAVILPSDLNYLKLGGRISSAAASLANLLKIVPILQVKDGKIDVLDKVRTEKKAIAKGIEYVSEVDDAHDYYWMIIHDHRDTEAKELAIKFREAVGQEILIRNFGAVILSHTGPNTLAFGRIRKIGR